MKHDRVEYVESSLLELLDRLIDKGVVLTGDLTISVADVELISLQLNVLLSSVEHLHGRSDAGHRRQLRGRRP